MDPEPLYAALLSLIVFLPTLGALVIALLIPKDQKEVIKLISLTCTLIVFVLTILMAFPAGPDGGDETYRFEIGAAGMQNVFNYEWIPSFNIYYFMGMDGISFPLVLLTTLIFFVSMWASWGIEKQIKGYCVLFLLLETGVLGVFFALDFFLFYVFWEVMLLPMYFLIGIWGGPRKEYAAIKFFLYTLLGGALMLIALLMLYFNSDLSDPDLLARLDKCSLREEQHTTAKEIAEKRLPHRNKVREAEAALEKAEEHAKKSPNVETRAAIKEAEQALKDARQAERSVAPAMHTFNIPALQQIGQHTGQFGDSSGTFLGWNIGLWAFFLLFIGFAIKVPAVPVHTWLPDAHVEAPTPISMILAGILLKLGGYGILRICYPICPEAGFDLRYFVCFIGILSMVYGAFAAMAQKDFKRLVAYSSVSHMGYVILGLGVWSATFANGYDFRYWAQGMNGAMFQMLAHGFSSAGMFFLVGVVYDRVHHRNLDEFGGLFHKMPVYSGMSIVIFFAGLGLPGLCGFIGEFFVTLSAWNFNKLIAVISAGVVILTAGYILWTVQRVYLGAEYKGPHGDHLTPMTLRERFIAIPLMICAIVFGVYPTALFNYMTPSINATAEQLTEWQKKNRPARKAVADDPDATPQRAAARGK